MTETGRTLRALRSGASMSRWRLAQLLHVSEATLRDWERGLRIPSDEALHAAARVLGSSAPLGARVSDLLEAGRGPGAA